MTREHALPAAVGALAALALLPAFWPTEAAAAICPATDAFPLTTGQNDPGNAGDVKVCNDAGTLFVTYEATFPFCLLETRLHVAPVAEPPDEPDDNIPQNPRGHPTPDAFAYLGDDLGCVGEDTFEIPLAAIGEEEEEGVSFGDTVVVAAFALLEESEGTTEEAWGGDLPFVERGPRATYFEYTVQELPAATACVCDQLVAPNETSGADVLEQLCPKGQLAPGATFVEEEGQLGVTVFNAIPFVYQVGRIPDEGAWFCDLRDGSPSAAAMALTEAQFDACTLHLRVSCGQPVP